MQTSPAEQEDLLRAAHALVDQKAARVIVAPNEPEPGFWFGGGNMIEDADGSLLVIGRFRNAGDSRTGLYKGDRGLELAIFRSRDQGQTFKKEMSWSKADLNIDGLTVLSIEGAALRRTASGYEMFVSTEKGGLPYPPGLDSFQKPGTGVWTIEHSAAPSLDALAELPGYRTLLASEDPRTCHVKDPFLYETEGELIVGYCTHPFSWSSSNTAFARWPDGAPAPSETLHNLFPRGFTWDVAMTRVTSVVDLNDRHQLVFYCGGESLRDMDEHATAVKRPRGYSCEEIGGVAFTEGGDIHRIQRLSVNLPAFISPHGTGCSRYVDVLATKEFFFVTWQQAQADGSQPLVLNRVARSAIESILP